MPVLKKTFLNSSYLLWFGIPVFIYQVLTARMISQIFGDLFHVQLLIIAVSYLGHSLGSLLSSRGWFRLYSSHLALCFCNVGLISIWYFSSALLSWGQGALLLTALVFFAISFFSSLLFPLLFTHPEQPRKNFNVLYFWFHFLVVFALYAVDLYALGAWGLTAVFIGLLVMDFFFALHWFFHREPGTSVSAFPWKGLQQRDLFILSIVSGVTQGLLYRQIQSVIAPLSFHYDLFLSGLMLGWSLSSVWFLKPSRRLGFSVETFTSKMGVLLAALTLWFFAWPPLWSAGISYFNTWDGQSLGIRTLFAMGLVLPCAFFFGCLIPLYHREEPRTPIGNLLAVNSAGNAVGILIYSLILFRWTTPAQLWFTLAAIALIAVYKRLRIPILATTAILLALSFALVKQYHQNLGSYQYRNFESWVELSQTITQTDVFKSNGSEVTLATTMSEGKMLFMNGHYSVLIPPSMKAAPADVMMGLPGLHYVQDPQSALIIGLGTGFTAQGAARVFKNLDIVDIDTAMVHLTSKITSPELLESKNVQFIEADGLTYLRTSPKKYDLIVNNVPSPVYFASGKLWTDEAFAAITARLSENGVFFQWLSAEFSDADLDVVFRTMRGYFSHCDLYTLTYGFHGLVCAQSGKSLVFNSAAAERLSSLLGLSSTEYLALLDAISFKGLPLPSVADLTPRHTLDKPYLEMQTSWSPPGWGRSYYSELVFEKFGLKKKLAQELTVAEREKKCRAIVSWYDYRTVDANTCSDLGLE